MSKLIDRLKQVSQEKSQPMGFRAAQAASTKPKIQLLACLAEGDVEKAIDYVAGADAALLSISKQGSGRQAIKKMSGNIEGLSWGIRFADHVPDLKQLVKSGCDFVTFSADSTPLAAIQDDEAGKIMEVEASISEGLLRAVNEITVDAVFVSRGDDNNKPLTWHDLLLFQRFAELLNKPLLVPVPPSVTAGELEIIWKAGVEGVLVDVGSNQPEGTAEKLRKIIDKLPYPAPDKDKKTDAILPGSGKDSSAVVDVDEEEDY